MGIHRISTKEKKSIPYKPYVRGKHVESLLGICKNMIKKVFNLNNTIPHSVCLVNPITQNTSTYLLFTETPRINQSKKNSTMAEYLAISSKRYSHCENHWCSFLARLNALQSAARDSHNLSDPTTLNSQFIRPITLNTPSGDYETRNFS